MMRVQFGWIGQKSLAGKEIKWGKENHHRMHSFAALPPGAAHNKTTKIKARKKDFNKGRVAESKNLAQKNDKGRNAVQRPLALGHAGVGRSAAPALLHAPLTSSCVRLGMPLSLGKAAFSAPPDLKPCGRRLRDTQLFYWRLLPASSSFCLLMMIFR